MSSRDDLDPVSVRIIDEVDAHILVLIAHAAHRLVFLIGFLHIIHLESQMEFIVPQIVGFLAITQPGELERKPVAMSPMYVRIKEPSEAL